MSGLKARPKRRISAATSVMLEAASGGVIVYLAGDLHRCNGVREPWSVSALAFEEAFGLTRGKAPTLGRANELVVPFAHAERRIEGQREFWIGRFRIVVQRDVVGYAVDVIVVPYRDHHSAIHMARHLRWRAALVGIQNLRAPLIRLPTAQPGCVRSKERRRLLGFAMVAVLRQRDHQ